MHPIDWRSYPLLAEVEPARQWLELIANLKAKNTLAAYLRGLDAFFAFCHGDLRDPATGLTAPLNPEHTRRVHLAQYANYLMRLPGRHAAKDLRFDGATGLAPATIQQRLTAVRLWFDFLIEQGVRRSNPVGRGRYSGSGFEASEPGLVRRRMRLPWIPNDDQWRRLLEAARQEPLRNRVMLALQYEGALRREELVALRLDDIDVAHRLVRIRPETTKGRAKGRIVCYTPTTGILYRAYLQHRKQRDPNSGPLFLSASNRNRHQPLSASTWSKVIERVRERAVLPRFTTHTPRHLCLTDLARAGWDLKELAQYAGHKNPQTTLLYVHLSGRDLAPKFAKTMQRYEARLRVLVET